MSYRDVGRMSDKLISGGTEETSVLEIKNEPTDMYCETYEEQLMTSIRDELGSDPDLTECIGTAFDFKQVIKEEVDQTLMEEIANEESINFMKSELDILDEQVYFEQEVVYQDEKCFDDIAPSDAPDPLLLSYKRTLNKSKNDLTSTFSDSTEERCSLRETESSQDVGRATSKELEEESRPITIIDLPKEAEPTVSKELEKESQSANSNNKCQIIMQERCYVNLKSTLDKKYPLLDGHRAKSLIDLDKESQLQNFKNSSAVKRVFPLTCTNTYRTGKMTTFELKKKLLSLMEDAPVRTKNRCFAPGCLAVSSENTQFFYFPRNASRTQEWLQRVGINCSLEEAKQFARRRGLCSRHFGDDQYLTPEKKKLSSIAVPFPLSPAEDTDLRNES